MTLKPQMVQRHLHKAKQAVLLAWHRKSLELLRSGEFILGISFGYDKDPYLNHQYLRIAFLNIALYFEWEY